MMCEETWGGEGRSFWGQHKHPSLQAPFPPKPPRGVKAPLPRRMIDQVRWRLQREGEEWSLLLLL